MNYANNLTGYNFLLNIKSFFQFTFFKYDMDIKIKKNNNSENIL